jgi:hypothetical protein
VARGWAALIDCRRRVDDMPSSLQKKGTPHRPPAPAFILRTVWVEPPSISRRYAPSSPRGMVNPIVWGPSAWEALFACAWACPRYKFDTLHATVQAALSSLPCEKCIKHSKRARAAATRRLEGALDSPQRMFQWLYLLKDEVNRTLHRRSTDMASLTTRYVAHNGVLVNDIALADSLVLFAVDAEREGTEVEVAAFCRGLALLLPLPEDGALRLHLTSVRSTSIVACCLRAARATRIEHGIPPLAGAHYRRTS